MILHEVSTRNIFTVSHRESKTILSTGVILGGLHSAVSENSRTDIKVFVIGYRYVHSRFHFFFLLMPRVLYPRVSFMLCILHFRYLCLCVCLLCLECDNKIVSSIKSTESIIGYSTQLQNDTCYNMHVTF